MFDDEKLDKLTSAIAETLPCRWSVPLKNHPHHEDCKHRDMCWRDARRIVGVVIEFLDGEDDVERPGAIIDRLVQQGHTRDDAIAQLQDAIEEGVVQLTDDFHIRDEDGYFHPARRQPTFLERIAEPRVHNDDALSDPGVGTHIRPGATASRQLRYRKCALTRTTSKKMDTSILRAAMNTHGSQRRNPLSDSSVLRIDARMKERAVKAWRLAPTGAGIEDANVASQRAGLFTKQSLSQFGTVTLLVVREDGTQTTYLVTPEGEASQKSASLLATALGATAHSAEVPRHVLGATTSTRQMRFKPFSGTFRETQQGADPAEQARLLAASMSDGQWLAISIRNPGHFEYRRHSRWLEARMAKYMPQHHSLSTDTVIASFTVGSMNDADGDSLLHQLTAAMPGFDLPIRPVKPVSRKIWMAAWMLAALAVWAGGALPTLLSKGFASMFSGAFSAGLTVPGTAQVLLSTLLALPFVLTGYAVGRGWLKTEDTVLRHARSTGLFPKPRRYELWRGIWTPPSKGHQDDEGRLVGQRQGNYPFSHKSFILGPHLPVLLTSPHAGAVSGQKSASARVVPPALRRRIGPFLGKDEFNNPVYLSSRDLGSGLMATGRRGSGKSALLHGLFAWSCLDKVRPSGLPGSLGRNQSIIAFESKGEGATMYTKWARDVGDNPTLFEVADPDGWGINLLDIPGTWADRGAFFADMLKYVFDDGAIGPSSFMALGSFGTAALALAESEEGRVVLRKVDGMKEDPNFLELVYVMVGGRGDDMAVTLDSTITLEIQEYQEEGRPIPRALATAQESLRPYYGGNPPSSRRDAVTPPRNKIWALLAANHWWSKKHNVLTWDVILRHLTTVVVNTGPVTNPRSEHRGATLPDEVANQMTGMLMYTLQKAIIRNCSSWGADGYGVSIFADELAQLAGTDPRVITWLHDQGRSFGVRAFFATQRATQLLPEVRESVMDYATTIYFRQADGNAAAPIVADLGADGSQWTIADLVTLPRYTAAVRTAINDERQTPFTFKAHYFAADPSEFAEVQGWGETIEPAEPTNTEDEDW